LVEHTTENRGVPGSSPGLAIHTGPKKSPQIGDFLRLGQTRVLDRRQRIRSSLQGIDQTPAGPLADTHPRPSPRPRELAQSGRATTRSSSASCWPLLALGPKGERLPVPKVVFSKTLESADWPESRIARGDLADEVAAIKSEPGDDVIAYGGATFARALVRERLVDEYRLVIRSAATTLPACWAVSSAGIAAWIVSPGRPGDRASEADTPAGAVGRARLGSAGD